ncbi:hypothetical protein L2E82_09132 [Cichorium intybus]|uniref:Uncharacterized protein n=1 Tax=Cichorium intybus TaxID=13427 RepID=A0ACB9G7L4_CICIN|nr:hypothetical protein L2E82_09132 [Cichorium intybus]
MQWYVSASLLTVLTSSQVLRDVISALLMFSGLVSDGVYENVFLPNLPYVKGEHGNIYFQVKNDEDILQALASGDNLVVRNMICLDTTEMVNEMESLGQSDDDSDFEDEDSDFEDDESDNYGKVSVLEDDEDSDRSLGDWAKLESMCLSHPMDFAKQLADFVSDIPINYMDQPPSGISIHGLLRPAFVEENSKEELQKDESFGNGTSYYKSQPDAVAHSADKIISRVKSGGDKMTRALKSLCWRRGGSDWCGQPWILLKSVVRVWSG